jgi:hypothetical protein
MAVLLFISVSGVYASWLYTDSNADIVDKHYEAVVTLSDAIVQGGNLKHVMIDGVYESDRLYFVLEKVSDTKYLAYTMRYYDIRDHSIGTEIEVYMTVLEEGSNGVWTATQSYQGYARVNDPSIVSRAIDVTTWREK